MEERENVTDFIKLFESSWSDMIGSVAHHTAKEGQFNKKDVLPATDIIMILQAYQDEKIKVNMTKMQAFINHFFVDCTNVMVK